MAETGPFSPPADGPAGASIGEALAWLDRHVNLEAIESGKAGIHGEPSLWRIHALVDAMGSPQSAYPVVHVTGTNGKGSTTRMIDSLLRAQGVKAGNYTSPHLETVNERIQVGGEPISDEALAAQLGALAELERFVGVEASWFELMTAAAYRFFADEAVEAAVAEVGLGGRYDATNVADGTVSVVTNVDLDHTEILGESRSLIAAEKAGIVKKDAVVILGERDPDIAALFEEEARRVRASSVWHRGGEFEASKVRLAVGGRLVDLTTPLATYEDVFIPLHGRHQCDNAAAALAAAQAFVGGTLPLDVVREGLAAVKVPGRLEVLRRRPLVILDGAHNVAGARALASALEEDFAAAKRLVVVFGCLRNRQPSSLLAALNSERLWRLVACTAPSPRALPAADLLGAAGELGIEAEDGGEVGEAVERGLELTEEGDLLLVTGSLYVVGAARGALRRVPAGR